jgi:hypothetical protein
MLTRVLYRIAAVHFFAMACFCWVVSAGFVALQLSGGSFDSLAFAALFLGAGALAMQCAGEAWRAGRYDPLYDGCHSH